MVVTFDRILTKVFDADSIEYNKQRLQRHQQKKNARPRHCPRRLPVSFVTTYRLVGVIDCSLVLLGGAEAVLRSGLCRCPRGPEIRSNVEWNINCLVLF